MVSVWAGRTLAIAAVVVSVSGCRTAAPSVPPAASPGAGTPTTATAGATARDPEAIRWTRHSAEHHAIFLQVYRQATVHVEHEAAGRARGTWAVVLDADETVLDNSLYQVERSRAGLPFTPESWRAWVARREAMPLPGARAFLARVRDLGGRIAIVTNRTETECPDTEAVFVARALAFDVMLCKPDDGPSDKNPRFEAVARGTTSAGLPPLDVIAYLGDNIQDFPQMSQAVKAKGDAGFARFGERLFVLPNPMYGSWERN